MLKSFILSLIVGLSFIFGHQNTESSFLPPRQDYLDSTSSLAQIRLQRAHAILSTLVPDPQKYNVILSSNPALGGEAVPSHIYSDKPTIIIYQGLLSPNRSNEEIAFVLAHEIGHLELSHHDKMNQQMDKIFNGHPINISGLTYSIYFQKLQEQEADLYGLKAFKQAHYNTRFFAHTLSLIKINPNIHFGTNKPFKKEPGSLSMSNSHFGIRDRFELLTQLSA